MSFHIWQIIFAYVSRFAILYVAFVNLTYLSYTILALKSIRDFLRTRNKERLEQIFRTRLVPPISILCPAYNEGVTITELVRSLLRMLYSQHEVIVINDGSKDGTLQALIETFSMQAVDQDYENTIPTMEVRGVYASARYPKLIVVDKANGGKADALNAGINASQYPLVCAVDADAVLEEDALLHLVVPMMDKQAFVPVSGGIIRAANGSKIVRGMVENIHLPAKPIALFQVVEYLRAFLTGRTAQASLNIMLIVSGAFGLFHKATVKAVGGYETGTVGEDFELVVRIARYLHEQNRPFEVSFIPQTVCWTEVPESWTTLARQRNRWHRGMLETLIKHRKMAFNPAYGRTGILGMGYFWLIETLGPVVELMGYILLPVAALLHLLSPLNAALFFLISIGLGIILSLASLILEEVSFHRYDRWSELSLLICYCVLENFGYRQLTLYWRLRGTVDFLRKKSDWGAQQRVGFGASKESA